MLLSPCQDYLEHHFKGEKPKKEMVILGSLVVLILKTISWVETWQQYMFALTNAPKGLVETFFSLHSSCGGLQIVLQLVNWLYYLTDAGAVSFNRK